MSEPRITLYGRLVCRVLADEVEIGYVTQIEPGQWSAHDMAGVCHGECYIDQWAAAKQLELGTRKARR